jgi:transcriptional regulator GlxA family with amidase domain
MRAAIVTFDGFSEIDTFIAIGVLNHLRPHGWSAEIASPSTQVTSMNGVTVHAQRPLEFANEADVVVFGSGIFTRAIADDGVLLDRLTLDPLRQTIGALGAGSLLLARLGLLGAMPVCTDPTTRPWVMAAGVRVLDEAFHARGPIATAGGCMASVYLAAWVLRRGVDLATARSALHHVAPVGEKTAWVERVLAVVAPFID